MLKRLTILLCALMLISVTSAQTLFIETYGVSPRIAGLDDADIFEYPFSGLTNVGVGTMVYFKVEADQAFQNLTWTIPTKPDGSAPTFGETMNEGDMVVYRQFTPDLPGHYVIEVSDFGGVIATVTINAAMYLGYNTESPNCMNCHNNSLYGFIGDTWQETGHYSDTERAFNGELSSHFREFCLECHTTGYDANPTAVNGGFDDYEFVYPDSLYPGQWDNLFQQFPEAMSMARIQCEACHGPGGEHYGQTGNSAMVTSLDAATCGICHDEGTHHNFPQQWDWSAHAVGNYVGYAGGRAGCADCHSGSGFVAKVNNGNVGVSPAPPAISITCATCHDPHDASNPGQLRLTTATLANGFEVPLNNEGRLCINCHQARRDAVDYTDNYLDNLSSHYGPHHGPQGDLLVGQNAITWGYSIPSSPHLQAIEKACVGCHMGEGPVDPEGNFELAGGHTFSMRQQDGTANVGVCEPCHGDVGDDFNVKKLYINGIADHDEDGVAEGLQDEVHGLLEELYNLLPNDGAGHLAITDSSVTKLEAQAAYNYLLVEEDRSFGIHNPEFAVELLKLTIGVMKGEISDVAPEDGQIPVSFELAQNYPNPFNPTTTINFSIPKASDVTLTVYDALGREVAKLVDEQMAAGKYSVNWNASNNASGIYFYRITTNENVQVKKMVLVK